MDIDQLTQMVTWLDEEHRRERGGIAKLQQRIESQATEIVEQARRVQELEGQLASTQAQLVRFAQVDQALQQLKNELVLMLQRQDEQHAKDLRESERLRAGERESAARNIAEVRKELPRFSRIEEELQQRKVEDQRLTEIVLALRQQLNGINKDIDERTRSLPFLMEQRTQDNKRIAQLQQETVELFKRTESASGKLQLLESNQQRIERGLAVIQPIPAQIREEVTSFVESTKLKDVERDRQMARWHEEMEQQRVGIELQHKKLQEFDTHIADAKRVSVSLQGFEESIRREQHQVAQLQRLAEERQRKELDDFTAEDEKRWKKQILEWDGRWAEQQKVNKDLAVQFPPIRKEIDSVKALVRQLWRLQETYGTQRMQEAQRWLQALESSLGDIPKELK
ncbi:MAG: hypothetical protein H6649_14855 [Caldilineae bacterium]|nr:hypothetical protein [Anaerolineae bacterium]MCB0203343.1 hypothetical protein [Anaerolineae bacterium]MCB0255946.1 hypothetical protein [Anaerolineae bacterium]MCB9155321.1 hypothetical protein [Caldilineae bacterium]